MYERLVSTIPNAYNAFVKLFELEDSFSCGDMIGIRVRDLKASKAID